MKNILVVSGHTDLNDSVANKLILEDLKAKLPSAGFDLLDELYPDFKIDVKAEQEKLTKADIIVLQFPVFWYSYPSLMHKWMEDVFVFGFSHGTDVWLGNAQDLIRNKTCTLKNAISARDDIMMYLIHHGVDALKSFKIMENVRKGKGISTENVEDLKSHDVPDWYIDSCQKIKYLFPRAHATAYVMMAYRIAYCKVHYPLAYYAAYFSIRADEFDANEIVKGERHIKSEIKKLEDLQLDRKLDLKESATLAVLQLAYEMYLRGFKVEKGLLKHGDILYLYTDGIEESTRRVRDPMFQPKFVDVQVKKVNPKTGQEEVEYKTEEEKEEFGPERVSEIIEAVLNRRKYRLTKVENPKGDEVLEFDFTEGKGTIEETILALAACEKVFRMYKKNDLNSTQYIKVDKIIDAFLEKYFNLYSYYAANKVANESTPNYLDYEYLQEDEQSDDLTMLAIKRI